MRLRASLLFEELESVDSLHLAVRFKPDGVSDWPKVTYFPLASIRH